MLNDGNMKQEATKEHKFRVSSGPYPGGPERYNVPVVCYLPNRLWQTATFYLSLVCLCHGTDSVRFEGAYTTC